MAIFKKQYALKMDVSSNVDELNKAILDAKAKGEAFKQALEHLNELELKFDVKGLTKGK